MRECHYECAQYQRRQIHSPLCHPIKADDDIIPSGHAVTHDVIFCATHHQLG